MKSKVLWTERVRRDLLGIGGHIARDKPEAASRRTNKLLEAVERTAMFPTSGRIVPEIGRSDIREVIHGNYRIVFHLEELSITALTIFECHQLIDESLAEGTDSE